MAQNAKQNSACLRKYYQKPLIRIRVLLIEQKHLALFAMAPLPFIIGFIGFLRMYFMCRYILLDSSWLM